MEYLHFLVATILFLPISFLWSYFSHRNNCGSSTIPINFPIFGMIPSVMLHLHRIPDYAAEILQQTKGTFIIKGPWLTGIELLLTADPANVHYIMCKHHEHFNRGANYQEKLEALGDGLLIAEADKWKYQRKIAMSSFTSPLFRKCMVETLQHKLEKGLIPFLDRSHNEGLVVDLQEVFYRLASDITFKLLIGRDTNFLSFDPTSSQFFEIVSAHDAEDAVLERYILPDFVWKLKGRVGIGKQGKYVKFIKIVRDVTDEMIRKKREELAKAGAGGGAIDLITLYMKENYGAAPDPGFKSTDVFLRDTFVNFLLAGKDTVSPALSWLFWLLITHPQVEAKIKEELLQEANRECDIYQLGNANKLVYLHATIFEALRLYPSVPFLIRGAEKQETLPSGHQVNPWTSIILNSYAMGRMKWVWGEDCEEFKPERWITDKGAIKHEPSHKFFSFNSGLKICLGKDIAMLQMKEVVRQVLSHGYRFEVVEGHRVEPASSVILRMKHGLKVKIIKDMPDSN